MENHHRETEGKSPFSISPQDHQHITNYLKQAGLPEALITHIHKVANAAKGTFPQKLTMDSALSFQEREKAKVAIRPLAGNVLGMDHASAEEIYRYGLNYIGIKTDQINLEGLKSLTEREVNYRSPQRVALASDQAQAAEDFNPEEILQAYVNKMNAK